MCTAGNLNETTESWNGLQSHINCLILRFRQRNCNFFLPALHWAWCEFLTDSIDINRFTIYFCATNDSSPEMKLVQYTIAFHRSPMNIISYLSRLLILITIHKRMLQRMNFAFFLLKRQIDSEKRREKKTAKFKSSQVDDRKWN